MNFASRGMITAGSVALCCPGCRLHQLVSIAFSLLTHTLHMPRQLHRGLTWAIGSKAMGSGCMLAVSTGGTVRTPPLALAAVA